ncbi:thiolase family protein [Flindersiella endophytica]
MSAVIVAARRTPIGTAGRALAGLRVEELAAPVLRALVAELASRPGLRGRPVDDVVLGNCMGPGGNPARVSALAAGLGVSVTGLTVDRQCGSGLAAITVGAAAVEAGRASLVLAGGVESASTAPIRAWRDSGETYDRAPFAPEPFADPEMGEAADALARSAGISRRRQDEYAVRSHARAVAAYERERFDQELVPVGGLDRDERVRTGLYSRPDRLARLRPAFVPDGTVTAGNSCGISDGAAAVALVPHELRAGAPGLRILDWECAGCDPALPGIGPVPAIRNLLARQGCTVADLAAVEIVEAFAAQVLACTDALGLDPEVVCPDGGALALGHPWGASGAVAMVRLFSRLAGHDNGPGRGLRNQLGLAAAAIGGGMGIACLVEAVR